MFLTLKAKRKISTKIDFIENKIWRKLFFREDEILKNFIFMKKTDILFDFYVFLLNKFFHIVSAFFFKFNAFQMNCKCFKTIFENFTIKYSKMCWGSREKLTTVGCLLWTAPYYYRSCFFIPHALNLFFLFFIFQLCCI